MIALSSMSYFDRTILSIAAPGIMKEFGFSETAMGSVFSAFLLSYAILMGPVGALADRFGPRLVLTLGGIGNTILTGLTGMCSSLGGFWAIRLALGIATAPLYPACARMTANWFPATGVARVQSMVLAGSALGSAVSPIAFAALIAWLGWRASFWVAALATGVLYVVWHWSVRDYPPNAASRSAIQERPKVEWAKLLRQRNLVLLTLSYFCLNYFEYIFFYWLYYYFGEVRHMGKSESAQYVTIVMLTSMVMMPLGGWISDRLTARYGRKKGRRIVPLATMALSAVLLYVGAGGLGTAATVAALSLAFGFSESAEGAFWASAIDFGQGQAGAAGGMMNSGGNLGGILAPILTPWVASYLGWTAGLYFGCLMVILGMAAWFFIDPDKTVAQT
jgi:ACS family glucarate transporter-like MFS transporter